MSRDSVYLTIRLGGVLFVLLLSLGCASGDIGETAPECTSDEDCAAAEFCNVVAGTCNVIVNPNNANNVNNSADVRLPDTGNPNNQNNQSDMQQEFDMAADLVEQPDMVVTCNPACEAGETCDPTGTCVEACMPSCQAPEVCTAQGCRIPDCQTSGDACDLNRRDQGSFFCLSEAGQGKCFSKCDDELTASTCPTGEYCVNVGPSANVCLESDCTDHPDCAQGTCVRFDNDFGACFQSGSIGEGQSCSVSNSMCEVGTICRRTMAGSDTGVCASVCDYWASSSDCPSGQSCGIVFAPRTGLCTTDETGPGSTQFAACTSPGDFCGDGLVCLSVNATNNFCFGYCRPEANDCNVPLPSGTAAGCDIAAFPGLDTIGLCNPVCDPGESNPCGQGAVCIDNGFGDFICRLTCTAGNEVDDCCGGTSPCNFTCNSDSLCE